jgi:hypothetical protein
MAIDWFAILRVGAVMGQRWSLVTACLARECLTPPSLAAGQVSQVKQGARTKILFFGTE